MSLQFENSQLIIIENIIKQKYRISQGMGVGQVPVLCTNPLYPKKWGDLGLFAALDFISAVLMGLPGGSDSLSRSRCSAYDGF